VANATSDQIVTHPDLIYDVGMHRGEDTEFYLLKGFRVIAFEANPDLIAENRKKFAKEINEGRLVIVEGAIVNPAEQVPGAKTVKFYRNREMSVWGTVSEAWVKRNDRLGTTSDVIEVPVVDFGACLRTYGIPHYLKVDIEGADLVCLEELLKLGAAPAYISIEADRSELENVLTELSLLERLGYSHFKAVQQLDISSQVEPDPPAEGVRVGHKFEVGSSGLFGRELPGTWRTKEQITREYKTIFRLLKLFGEDSIAFRFPPSRLLVRAIRRALSRLLRRPIPGWYDTHARHRAVTSTGL
jgi:FkbM family methyltransferase